MWSPKPKRKKGASGMEAMEADATFDQTTPVPVASATPTPGGKTIVLDSGDKNRPSHQTWKHKQDHTAGAGSHQEEAARVLVAHVDDQVKEVIGMIKQLETPDKTVRSTDVAMEDARQESIATAAQKPFLDDDVRHQNNNRPKGPVDVGRSPSEPESGAHR
ncbi:hypothetical protein BG006_010770 [Podila minutissima]|uniref:Uncharacterized protein n=1 Tax=Podila minutissima TaxID=64525 RepID=A0A9P5VIE4_9FUNG|nr:hypothetical protein BG006_010770 [Podila minutissima]